MSLEDINNLPDEIPAKHIGHRTDHEIIHSGLKAIVEELAKKASGLVPVTDDTGEVVAEVPIMEFLNGFRTGFESLISQASDFENKLSQKQDPVYRIYGPEDELIEEVPLNQFLTGLYEAMIFSPVITVEIPGYSRYLERDFRIVEELPSEIIPNVIYIVRAPDGILTWHLPVLLADGEVI